LRSFGPEPRIPALFYFVQEIKVGSKHSKTHVPKGGTWGTQLSD